jgi:Lon protease-like protein
MTQEPDTHFLRLFPLESVVLFPGMELPLVVFEPRYRQLTQECLQANEPFGVLLLRSGREVGDHEPEPYQVGTTAHIQKAEEIANGRMRLMTVGKDRFRVRSFHHDRPYLSAQVEYLQQEAGSAVPSGLLQQIKDASSKYVQALMALRGGYLRDISLPDDPEDLSYLVALFLEGRLETQQRLLEAETITERLTQESTLLTAVYNEVKEQVDQRWWGPGFRRN